MQPQTCLPSLCLSRRLTRRFRLDVLAEELPPFPGSIQLHLIRPKGEHGAIFEGRVYQVLLQQQ